MASKKLHIYLQGKTTAQVRSGERKTLKTLQLAADGSVAGIEKKPVKKMIQPKILSSCSPIRVFKDRKQFLEMGVQTERPKLLDWATQTDRTASTSSIEAHNDSGLDEEAYDLMVKDPIPESYWRELAEERRLSLAEALSENEMLHQSMDELKEENLNLSQLASQAEYLASVLNSIMSDKENNTSTEEETDEIEDASEKEEKEKKTEDIDPSESNDTESAPDTQED